VHILINVAWALYKSRNACESWNDVHLPDGWLPSHRWVPIPLVPLSHRALRNEIVCRWSLLPLDLHADLAYAMNSPLWDTFDVSITFGYPTLLYPVRIMED
jgi:hypothetical protein